MKVVQKKTGHKLRFGDLDIGTVFTVIHTRDPNTVYMKMNKDLSVNAVSLEHCYTSSIGIHEEVITIDGAFIENGAESS